MTMQPNGLTRRPYRCARGAAISIVAIEKRLPPLFALLRRMSFQIGDRLLQLLLSGGIGRAAAPA